MGRGRAIDRAARPACSRSPQGMTRRPRSQARRRAVAVTLVVLAVALIVTEPFDKGVVLLSITSSHGVDAGDLPAVCLLATAAWLAS